MLFSLAATRRGLAPAWIASTPSMASSIDSHSDSLTRLSRLASGNQKMLAVMTPQSVATKAEAILAPSVDGADDPDGRAVAAHVLEDLGFGGVGGPLGVDLGAQDLGHLVGVGTVDGH